MAAISPPNPNPSQKPPSDASTMRLPLAPGGSSPGTPHTLNSDGSTTYHVKVSGEQTGTIVKWDPTKQFGFVQVEGHRGGSVFLHNNNLFGNGSGRSNKQFGSPTVGARIAGIIMKQGQKGLAITECHPASDTDWTLPAAGFFVIKSAPATWPDSRNEVLGITRLPHVDSSPVQLPGGSDRYICNKDGTNGRSITLTDYKDAFDATCEALSKQKCPSEIITILKERWQIAEVGMREAMNAEFERIKAAGERAREGFSPVLVPKDFDPAFLTSSISHRLGTEAIVAANDLWPSALFQLGDPIENRMFYLGLQPTSSANADKLKGRKFDVPGASPITVQDYVASGDSSGVTVRFRQLTVRFTQRADVPLDSANSQRARAFGVGVPVLQCDTYVMPRLPVRILPREDEASVEGVKVPESIRCWDHLVKAFAAGVRSIPSADNLSADATQLAAALAGWAKVASSLLEALSVSQKVDEFAILTKLVDQLRENQGLSWASVHELAWQGGRRAFPLGRTTIYADAEEKEKMGALLLGETRGIFHETVREWAIPILKQYVAVISAKLDSTTRNQTHAHLLTQVEQSLSVEPISHSGLVKSVVDTVLVTDTGTPTPAYIASTRDSFGPWCLQDPTREDRWRVGGESNRWQVVEVSSGGGGEVLSSDEMGTRYSEGSTTYHLRGQMWRDGTIFVHEEASKKELSLADAITGWVGSVPDGDPAQVEVYLYNPQPAEFEKGASARFFVFTVGRLTRHYSSTFEVLSEDRQPGRSA